MVTVAPGNLLDDHGFAATAIHASHRIEQKDQKPPEGDEFVAPFRELIITWRRFVATRTNGHRTLTRTHADLDALEIGTEAGVLVDEAAEMMAAVQNRNQIHSADATSEKTLAAEQRE
jgi:hypothetical protein